MQNFGALAQFGVVHQSLVELLQLVLWYYKWYDISFPQLLSCCHSIGALSWYLVGFYNINRSASEMLIVPVFRWCQFARVPSVWRILVCVHLMLSIYCNLSQGSNQNTLFCMACLHMLPDTAVPLVEEEVACLLCTAQVYVS
jgi:hypothetical protein